MGAGGPLPLTPLEAAAGMVLEPRGNAPRLGEPTSPVRAFEQALLPALLRPPCVVSFSGGRDSSAVLAVATRLARRERLPLPIPVTHRFPAAADTLETEWQEEVVRSLGIDDWIRLDASDELDCVGPIATEVLRRHGLLWPCNLHFHVPIFAIARGGSLLTGVGGDEALSTSGWSRQLKILRGRARPGRGDIRPLIAALSPAPFKRARVRRAMASTFEWLQPAARSRAVAALAAEAAAEPLRWRRRFDWLLGFAYLRVGTANLALLAVDADVRVSHPFIDSGFHGSLAALPPQKRFASRAEAMHMLVGDDLPGSVRRRATKAAFGDVLWNRHSRAFAGSWSGCGVDEALVDHEALREQWRLSTPDSRTFTLLQSAWLAAHAHPNQPNLVLRSVAVDTT